MQMLSCGRTKGDILPQQKRNPIVLEIDQCDPY